jgi:hypothetical protein
MEAVVAVLRATREPESELGPGRRNLGRRARRPSGMRLHGPLPGVPRRLDALVPLALGAVAAVALSACAVVHAPDAARQPGQLTGSTGIPLTSAKSPAQPALPAPPALTPRQRAVADSGAILASFAVPSGARKLSAAPTVSNGVLTSPAQVPGTPDLVDKAQWWIAPGAPQSVLA